VEIETMTISISDQDLAILQETVESITGQVAQLAAVGIYEDFARLPGADRFLYDLPARILSTRHLITQLARILRQTPFDPETIEAIFYRIGEAHARAGLPMSLIAAAPAIFADNLADVATANNSP
jgi:hypothetical protein